MRGVWRDNAAFLALHTQDPRTSMNDRFDLQFVSRELVDGVGLDYVAESYQVVKNDGTHTLGAAIDTSSDADPAVLAALMAASDHLPVVADYRVVPEPTVGVLLLISSIGLLRPRLLGLARREVLNQTLPCSMPALTGPGSGVILSATGSRPVSGPLGFNGSAKRADQCSSW